MSVTLTTLVIENKEAVFGVFYGSGEIIEGEGALPEALSLPRSEAKVEEKTTAPPPLMQPPATPGAALQDAQAPAAGEQHESFTSERAAPARQTKSASVRAERKAEKTKAIAEPFPAEQEHNLSMPAETPTSPAREIPGVESEPSAPKERSMDESASQTMVAPSAEAPRGIAKEVIRERTPDEWLAHIRDLFEGGTPARGRK